MENTATAGFRYEYHAVNGLRLHVGHMGPVGGEMLLFLHGFPEFSQSWLQQADYFAKKGYHVVVPDQRGYNLSEKPATVEDYTLPQLVGDMVALITALSAAPVFLVGHDWGGGVAWMLAQKHPELVKKLIILNMPHPEVMKKNLRSNPGQMLRSWYAGFFQLPILPEQFCSAFNFKGLAASMVKTARPGTFPKAYIAACKTAWRQPGALTAMINWYRAFFQHPVPTDGEIKIPVLLLWGRKDQFLSSKMAHESIARCPAGQLIFLNKATHWLHHEEPEVVNGYLWGGLKGMSEF